MWRSMRAAAWASPLCTRCALPACKALEEAILSPYEGRAKTLELPAIVTSNSRPAPEHYRDEPQICATVTSLEAAEAARAEGATRIYMTTDVLRGCRTLPCRCI